MMLFRAPVSGSYRKFPHKRDWDSHPVNQVVLVICDYLVTQDEINARTLPNHLELLDRRVIVLAGGCLCTVHKDFAETWKI